jgi:NAD(P)-dependent dehydrogenase (short-subunit alcohol dehydrogenase family)
MRFEFVIDPTRTSFGHLLRKEEVDMPLQGKYALITGSSRGIGRGIALKLAERGVNVAVHYYSQAEAARETLTQVQARGAKGCIIQADVTRPEDIRRMFDQVKREFGRLDVFVSNARPELAAFYRPPMEITLDQWTAAIDSQAQAFLVGSQVAASLMPDNGRIIAISYSPSGRTGSWQPWVAMGAAKAALDALVRYQDMAREWVDSDAPDRHPRRHRQRGRVAVHGRSGLYHRANDPRGRRRVRHGHRLPARYSAGLRNR